MSGNRERIVVQGLATVVIDTTASDDPTVCIVLDPIHDGRVDVGSIDVDDFLQDGWTPGGVFFEGSNGTSVNNSRLVRFIELCAHWDGDFDGVYDADELIQKILGALRDCNAETVSFRRPTRGLLTNFLMAIMPPQPERHIVLSYENIVPRFRLRHYLMAVPAIIVILGLVQLQIQLLPWTGFSAITGAQALAQHFGWIAVGGVVVGYIGLNRLIYRNRQVPLRRRQLTYGFFSSAAVREEQTFREGAERWNLRQRLTSDLVFGLVHLGNLFYPIAAVLPIALGGSVFMAIYLRVYRQTRRRRNAVLEASVTHRVYNRIALVLAVLFLLGLTGGLIKTLLAFVGALVAVWGGMVFSNIRDSRKRAAQLPAVEMASAEV